MEIPTAQNNFLRQGKLFILDGITESNGNVGKTHLEAGFSPSYVGTADIIPNSSPQIILTHEDAILPNSGLMIHSSLASHACMQNGGTNTSALELPDFLSNYKDLCVCSEQLLSSLADFGPLETHMKRFLMFDHNARKRQVSLPPVFLELGGCLPYPTNLHPNGHHDTFSPIVDTSADNIVKALDPISEPQIDASLPGFKSAGENRICNNAAIKEEIISGTFFLAEGENSSHISRGSGNEKKNGTNSSTWHENTDDIDALLDSEDDEVTSTGHSPQDSFFHKDSICDSYSENRRFKDSSEKEAVDITSSETDSTWESAVGAARNNLARVCDNGNDLAVNIHEISSETVSNDTQNVINQVSRHSRSPLKVRRQKIKRTIKTLRKIIPGGNCMDAAIVLDEAIQYLRSLQCKVQRFDKGQIDWQ